MSRGMHLGKIAKASVSSPIQACFDGKYVWVTNSGATKVFEVWANSTADLGIDPERKVTEVGSVSGHNNCSFLSYGNGFMWIAKKSAVSGRSTMLFDTIIKVNTLTYEVVETIRTPISQPHKEEPTSVYSHMTHEYIMMNSVLHFAQGKLWMVEDYVDALSNGGIQRVWVYDTALGSWTSQTFSAKVQKNRAQITSANGFVYISAYNSLAVLKYNADSTAFVSSIRGNANPNALTAQPDGKILVTSYNGLISHLKTDDSWTHDLQVDTDECTAIAFESAAQCWVVDGSGNLFRVGSDNYVYGSGYKDGQGQDTDYTLLVANTMLDETVLNGDGDQVMWNKDLLAVQGDMVDVNYNTLNKYSFSDSIDFVITIPSLTYEKWNGTQMVDVTQPVLVVVLTDSEVVVINTSEIKFGFPRPSISRSTMSAVGVGMITYGPNDYLGD